MARFEDTISYFIFIILTANLYSLSVTVTFPNLLALNSSNVLASTDSVNSWNLQNQHDFAVPIYFLNLIKNISRTKVGALPSIIFTISIARKQKFGLIIETEPSLPILHEMKFCLSLHMSYRHFLLRRFIILFLMQL